MDVQDKLDSIIRDVAAVQAELRVYTRKLTDDVNNLYSRTRKVELELNYKRGMRTVICAVGAVVGAFAAWILQKLHSAGYI